MDEIKATVTELPPTMKYYLLAYCYPHTSQWFSTGFWKTKEEAIISYTGEVEKELLVEIELPIK